MIYFRNEESFLGVSLGYQMWSRVIKSNCYMINFDHARAYMINSKYKFQRIIT